MSDQDWEVFNAIVAYCGDLYQMCESTPESMVNGFADAMNSAIFEMISFMASKGISRSEIKNGMISGGCAPDVADSYVYD